VEGVGVISSSPGRSRLRLDLPGGLDAGRSVVREFAISR
jgi:hypothetical protein